MLFIKRLLFKIFITYLRITNVSVLFLGLCIVVSSVAGLALEQVYNTSHDVVRRVATDPADPCLPSNHRNITHIGHRNINMRGTCPYTDGRLEDAWYHAGSYPISSYRNIPEMCSCGYKFPIWMNGKYVFSYRQLRPKEINTENLQTINNHGCYICWLEYTSFRV